MRASDGRSESSKSATRRQTLHLQYSQVFVPNEQATALILLVRRFPDTLDRLDIIGSSKNPRRAA